MKKKKILIELSVYTDANEDAIEKALIKGIYYGLDVKGVSAPKDVEEVVVRVYNS